MTSIEFPPSPPSSPASLFPPTPPPTAISYPTTLSHLPSELLSQIFTHTLPEKHSFKSSDSPLLLTQVSSQWRSVALANPRLWCRWIIPDWGELPKNALELVKMWVERSGGGDKVGEEERGAVNLEVGITLFNEDMLVFPDSETLKELFQLLRATLSYLKPHRQRFLKFRGVFPEHLMNEVGVSEMINAENIYYCGMLGDRIGLDLDLQDADTEEEVNNRLNVHTKLNIGDQQHPSLKTLVICGCAAYLPPISLQTQLTHLELLDLHRGGELCQETAFRILQSLPLLKTCVLDLTKFESRDWDAPLQRHILENLELLFISWVFPADIDTLLKSIATPNLGKLGLRGTPMVAQRPWFGLCDFLASSKAPISRISLGDFSAVDANYLECFRQTPDLVHLTINHAELSDEFFRALTPGSGSGATGDDSTLLRHLQIFNMGCCEGFHIDTFINFLKARAQDHPTLTPPPHPPSPPSPTPHPHPLPPNEKEKEKEGNIEKLREVAVMYCMEIEERHVEMLEGCGVENLVVEAAEDDSVYPYARVVETHRELLAVLYKNEEGGDGGDEGDEGEGEEGEEGEEGGEGEGEDVEMSEAGDENEVQEDAAMSRRVEENRQ